MPAARRVAYLSGTQVDSVGDRRWSGAAQLSAAQHGVVRRAQLRHLGLSDRQITRAVRVGHLHPVHRGVLAVGHPGLTHLGRSSAAVLACGPRAALGHRSAGAHWLLRPWSSPRIEVVIAGTGRPAHAGVVVHRHPDLLPDEVEVHDGVRVTTVARTLLDLGSRLPPQALRSAVSQAEILRVFDLRALLPLLDRHPRHRGAGRIRAVLASWEEPPRTRSPQEEAFPDLCARLGLPRPVMNATVLGMEIDALFPDHGVAVELDSRRFHTGVLKWEDDLEKRARLIAAGWVPLSYSYRHQREDGGRVVLETLGPALARGRPVHPGPTWT